MASAKPLPPVVIIAGWSGSGKTTLLERLIRHLAERGFRIATVKHDAHGFEMDQSGTDTWRHGEAGAVATAISSPSGFALVERRRAGERPLPEIVTLFGDVDLVLVEGYKGGPYAKLEVVGPDSDRPPGCLGDPLLFAVAADALLEAGVPWFHRDDIPAIAAAVLKQAGLA